MDHGKILNSFLKITEKNLNKKTKYGCLLILPNYLLGKFDVDYC